MEESSLGGENVGKKSQGLGKRDHIRGARGSLVWLEYWILVEKEGEVFEIIVWGLKCQREGFELSLLERELETG